MELQIKTPVQIVQELLALHTTRLEAAERLKNKVGEADAATLTTAHKQSEKFTSELMSELSTYGDAALSSVDKENAYQKTWTETLTNIDAMDDQQALHTFNTMEKVLSTIYGQYARHETDLPTTLHQIITRQASEL